MSPTHRVRPSDLDAIPRDAAVCRELVEQARAHGRSATVIATVDPEGAFQLAHDGCRKVALAVVHAAGRRPKGAAHHAVTFDAAASLVIEHRQDEERQCLTSALDDATDLRHVRGGSEYRGEKVPSITVDEAIAVLAELLDGLPALVDELLG